MMQTIEHEPKPKVKKRHIAEAILYIVIAVGIIIALAYVEYSPSVIVPLGETYRYTFNVTSNMTAELDPTITKIGEQYHRNILGFNNVTNFNATKWLSAGNATVANTLTKLTTEATSSGFTRAEGTVTQYISGGHYGYNVTITFTASATINLNAYGLQWSGVSNSDNNLFGAGAITPQTYNNGDKAIVSFLVLANDYA